MAVDPNFSTPHFITLLIEKGYLQDDYDLAVLRRPLIIDDSNIELLAGVVNGTIRYHLPIVYISKTYDNTDPVDVRFLASKLKGVAHVLVQKSNWLSSQCRRLCDDKNEYGGAIGIYYPNPAVEHKKFLFHYYTGSEKVLFDKVIRTVIQYANAQNVDSLYTWQGVSNALLTDRLVAQRAERLEAENAKKQTEDEADQLLETFDDDFNKLQKQVEDLTRANEALRQENEGLHAKLNATDVVPILFLGDDDFTSIEIANLGTAEKITVLDIDDRILNTIKKEVM